MTSADSLRQVLLRSSNSVRKASQGKNTIFPVIYPPHLHREFRIAWGFSFFGNLTHSHMPDAVPVRRTNGLPRASFRFHLTMDTLAFGYALGAIPCARDFHPLDCAHAWHTKNDRPSKQKGGRTVENQVHRRNFGHWWDYDVKGDSNQSLDAPLVEARTLCLPIFIRRRITIKGDEMSIDTPPP